MKVTIIGGGASGIMLASLLNKHSDIFNTTIIEKEEHIGKKLLLTGNGKCNFSNINIDENCYNHLLGYQIAKNFDCKEYFSSLGLLSMCDKEGRCYPLSNASNNVLDILRNNLDNINIINKETIVKIKKENNGYVLTSNNNNKYFTEILILACGGKTYYKDANGYLLASMLSMHITPLRPTLIGIKVDEPLASIANLRVKANVTLIGDGKKIFHDNGEILFKNDGLSGIVIFQMSAMMARNPYLKYELSLDLLPYMSEEEIVTYLKKYPSMTGLFAKMINQFIIKKAKSNNPDIIAKTIKNLRFSLVDTYDFKNAQVTSGGVSLNDLTENLESKANQNCYVIGEMADVDGICGGYNLHYAFASANQVYLDIIKKVKI